MKRFLWLGALLVATAPLTNAYAYPNGRSAIMAARLEKHADGWLAWYLPDDRYKVAGGIWKYVSTDLDTYYHRPDSPNILRQSKDHIIGFASAQDAEDAGYLPDPSDGTNATHGLGIKLAGKLTPAELHYLEQIIPILKDTGKDMKEVGAKITRGGTSMSNATNDNTALSGLAQVQLSSAEGYQKFSAAVAKLKQIKAPARFTGFHKQLIVSCQDIVEITDALRKGSSGSLTSFNAIIPLITKTETDFRQLQVESQKVGLNGIH